MVNRDLIAAKLAELSDRLSRVRAHCPDTADALRGDRDALDLVSFNLMLSVQSCADIASHIIADEGWPAARNLAEGFARLEERGVIDAPIAVALGRAVGLRNVVAYGYAGIDADAVHDAATAGVADIDAFARSIAAWAGTRAADGG